MEDLNKKVDEKVNDMVEKKTRESVLAKLNEHKKEIAEKETLPQQTAQAGTGLILSLTDSNGGV
nr:hypothetical protein [Eubacterium sp.]